MRKDNEEGICRKCKGETSIAFRRERRVLKTEEDSDTPVKTYEKVSIVRCQKDGCFSTVFKPSMIKYKQYAFHEIQSVIEKDFFKLSNTVVFTAACEKTQNNRFTGSYLIGITSSKVVKK